VKLPLHTLSQLKFIYVELVLDSNHTRIRAWLIFSKNILTSDATFGPFQRFSPIVALIPDDKPAVKKKLANWEHISEIVVDAGRKWTTKSSRDQNLRSIIFCLAKKYR
jgi:hypothetical protein